MKVLLRFVFLVLGLANVLGSVSGDIPMEGPSILFEWLILPGENAQASGLPITIAGTLFMFFCVFMLDMRAEGTATTVGPPIVAVLLVVYGIYAFLISPSTVAGLGLMALTVALTAGVDLIARGLSSGIVWCLEREPEHAYGFARR